MCDFSFGGGAAIQKKGVGTRRLNVPVFSRRHAVAILGILNEVFNDITENNFLGSFTDANNDYFNSEFDNLLESCYEDFVEDFAFDPDALPE